MRSGVQGGRHLLRSGHSDEERMMSGNSSSRGCASSCEPAPPLVCTLACAEQQERRANEFREAFVHLECTEPLYGAFRWFFRDEPGLEDRLRELAWREHDCCRFFDFHITREGGSVVWETRGPAAAAQVLEELMRLPEALSGAPKIETMKRVLSDAGLTFQADADEKAP
jgi:hypothetical protein